MAVISVTQVLQSAFVVRLDGSILCSLKSFLCICHRGSRVSIWPEGKHMREQNLAHFCI